MAKRLTEQYDEIFKLVGENFGLSKLSYEHYQRLNPDDTRKNNFDKFLERYLPINEDLKVEEYPFPNYPEIVEKIKELNDNPTLKKEDRITDSKSFFALGEKLPKKEVPHKSSKPIPVVSKKDEKIDEIIEENSKRKNNFFKNAFKNFAPELVITSLVSAGVSVGVLALGSYAAWPAAAMAAALNVTFVIPQTIFLTYCGYKLVKYGIKSGTFKKWFEKIKTKNKNKKHEKVDVEEITKDKTELFPTTRDFRTGDRDLDEELFGVREEPYPDSFKDESKKTEERLVEKVSETKVPPVPVLGKPKTRTDAEEKDKNDDEPIPDSFKDEDKPEEPKINTGAVETESVDKEDVSKPETIRTPIFDTGKPIETVSHDMHFSPRRQIVINDLNDSLVNYSSNTDIMIQENIEAKKQLTNFKRKNTRSYNKSKKDILNEIEAGKKELELVIAQTDQYFKDYYIKKDVAVYEQVMRERESALQKLKELEEKEQTLLNHLEQTRKENLDEASQRQVEINNKNNEIITRKDNFEERSDILQTILTKEEEKRVDSYNREVNTDNGEKKTIYMEAPRRIRETVTYDEGTTRRR